MCIHEYVDITPLTISKALDSVFAHGCWFLDAAPAFKGLSYNLIVKLVKISPDNNLGLFD